MPVSGFVKAFCAGPYNFALGSNEFSSMIVSIFVILCLNTYRVNLIINADLSNPPTSKLSFRELTFYAHEFCNYSVILETDNNKDIYYKYLKGWPMEFIEDILPVGEEDGLRIDIESNYAPTVLADRITSNNLVYLLKCIGFKLF